MKLSREFLFVCFFFLVVDELPRFEVFGCNTSCNVVMIDRDRSRLMNGLRNRSALGPNLGHNNALSAATVAAPSVPSIEGSSSHHNHTHNKYLSNNRRSRQASSKGERGIDSDLIVFEEDRARFRSKVAAVLSKPTSGNTNTSSGRSLDPLRSARSLLWIIWNAIATVLWYLIHSSCLLIAKTRPDWNTGFNKDPSMGTQEEQRSHPSPSSVALIVQEFGNGVGADEVDKLMIVLKTLVESNERLVQYYSLYDANGGFKTQALPLLVARLQAHWSSDQANWRVWMRPRGNDAHNSLYVERIDLSATTQEKKSKETMGSKVHVAEVELERRVREGGVTKVPPLHSVRSHPTSAPPPSPPNPHCKTIHLTLLDREDGVKELLFAGGRMDSVTGDDSSEAIEAMDAGSVALIGPDPDFAICIGSTVSTAGYPPWHLRLTELIAPGVELRQMDEQTVLAAQHRWASCQQRFGK